MPAVCLLEARLEASDVGFLVREAHLRGGGLVRGGQVGVPKRRPALRGRLLCGVGVVCRVEECAEWVRCSLPSAECVFEPAASDSEVGCYLLWCRVGPRFRRQGCCLGGRELWVSRWWRYRARTMWRAATFKPPPLWRRGGLWGGRVCCPWPRLWSMRGPPRPPRSTLPGGPGGCR